MYTHSFSSSFGYSDSSNSNTPPPMFYQNSNIGDGTSSAHVLAQQPIVMPIDQQMHYHHIHPITHQMMANPQQFGIGEVKQEEMENNNQQFSMEAQMMAQPFGQFGGIPEGNIQNYEQPQDFQPYQAMSYIMPYQPPVMDQFVQQQYQAQEYPMMNQFPDFDDSQEKENSEIALPVLGPKRKRREPKKKEKAVSMHQNTSCANCGCRETKMWRRSERGESECNACNLYERYKGTKRPAHLWKKESTKRRRRPAYQMSPAQEDGPSDETHD